jgi:hypothetical protein
VRRLWSDRRAALRSPSAVLTWWHIDRRRECAAVVHASQPREARLDQMKGASTVLVEHLAS